MAVTLRHFGGQTEDVPDDVAERLLAGGFVEVVGRSADVVETASLEPDETAMLPRAKPRRKRRMNRAV